MAFKKKIDIGSGEQFKFEKVGQQLEGYYVGSFPHQGDFGPTLKHMVKAVDGLKTIFGQTHLTQLLEGVNPGSLVRITLTGSKKMKKGNPMKMYELEYDEDETIDVAAVQAEAAASEEPQDDYDDAEYAEESEVEEDVDQAPPAPAPRRTAPPAPARAASAPAPKSAVSADAKARANALLNKRN